MASHQHTELLLFEESYRVGPLLGWLAVSLGLTEMPRYPQYRAGIFAAGARHPALLKALELVADRVVQGAFAYRREPLQSLVLTGPGLFTDAVDAWVGRPGTAIVSRWVSMRDHYGHAGMGTWKSYDPTEHSNLLLLLTCVAMSAAAWRWRSQSCRFARSWLPAQIINRVAIKYPLRFWLSLALAFALTLDRFVRVPYGLLPLNVLTGTPPHEHPARPCGWDYEANWTIHRVEGGPLTRFGPRPDNSAATGVQLAQSCWGMKGMNASFVADPMAIIPEEQPALQRALPAAAAQLWYLFYEAKDLGSDRGVIAVSTSVDQGRHWSNQGTVLNEPFHLSYPLIKYHELSGMVLMIPETNQANAISIYATSPADFPFGWYLVKRPLHGHRFADTSPVFFEGMWYIFTWYKWRLRLYYASDLLYDRWVEHPTFSLHGNHLRLHCCVDSRAHACLSVHSLELCRMRR